LIAIQITDLGTVDEPTLRARIARVAALPAIERRRRVVMVRDPALPSRALLALARRLRAATRAVGARLWVNDRLDVAALVEADGVHLGRRSVAVADARRLLGAVTVSVACHDVGEVIAARAAGADACTLSPIFPSPGKGTPLGPEALREARAQLAGDDRFLLVALGGLDASNAAEARSAGADGIAAIRADVLAPGPR
jgi:thiamine-phosphate pyrophosphorylase